MFLSYIFCYALLVATVSSKAFIPPDILWLDENEICKKNLISAKTHVCKVLDECKTAIQDIRDNVKYPTICSFKGKTPVVCCAPETVPREERVDKLLDVTDIAPELALHFDSYKDGSFHDNIITYSRPRRQIESRVYKNTQKSTKINA